ncbi:hypothetical protein EC968_010033 [Mortierella alpina]|nr:hypothetical protein EC968_010033 [Mortierella alpina]
MASSKDSLDLDEDLLDYGDAYDLDANDELLAEDLASVEQNGDEVFDLGVEDDFPLDPSEESITETTTVSSAGAKQETTHGSANGGAEDERANASATSNIQKGDSVENQNSQQQHQQHINNNPPYQRDGDHSGGYNRQGTNGSARPPHGNSSWRGRGGSAPMRGRGQQNYTGIGRGNFQGGAGMNPYPMMGMGMNPGMAPGMNMNMGVGMNMNMNMGMMNMGMNMNGPRYPGDGFGSQAMMNPYGVGSGMDGGRMNPAIGGMNARGLPGAVGSPGRTIHINPKFQNLAGIPPALAAGAGLDPQNQQPSSQPPQQSGSMPRPHPQDGGRGQARHWESNNVQDNGRSSGYDRANGSFSGNKRDDTYRPSSRSDRDDGAGSFSRGSTDRRPSDVGRSSSSDSPRKPTRPRSRSPPPRGSSGSITSRLTLGSKRFGDEQEDFSKARKSSGGSTPRSEHARLEENGSDLDKGSISFLRDKREGHDSGSSDAVPKGFVKMENVPKDVSDEALRKLAEGVSGVHRVLTITKGGSAVTLGFASVDEAKFFRRQINRFEQQTARCSCDLDGRLSPQQPVINRYNPILSPSPPRNRTTIEGSLVTVTLASS